MENNNKKVLLLIIIMISIALFSGTYAYWKWSTDESQKTLITFFVQGGYSCSADGGGNITVEDNRLAPTYCNDPEYALKRKVTVKPSVNGDGELVLNLWIDVISIDEGYSNTPNLKYILSRNSEDCTSPVASGTFYGATSGSHLKLLNNKRYTETVNDEYYLYIWLDEAETDTSSMNQTMELTLGGSCSTQAACMEPSTPVLEDGMIPVTIADNGTLTVVSQDDENWYKYCEKRWANAILVDSTMREEFDFINECNTNENVNSEDNPDCYENNYNYIPTDEEKEIMSQYFVNAGIFSSSTEFDEVYNDLYQNGYLKDVVNVYNNANDPDIGPTRLCSSIPNVNSDDYPECYLDYDNHVIGDFQPNRVVSAIERNVATLKTTEGVVINGDNQSILAYYTWIPRYSYAIPSPMTCGEIENVNSEDYPDCYTYDLSNEDKQILKNYMVNGGGMPEETADLCIANEGDYQGCLEFALNQYNNDNDPDIVAMPTLVSSTIFEGPRTIDILFENADDTKSIGNAVDGNYYTHPAFTYGNTELAGFWVGKFETTGTSVSSGGGTSMSKRNNENIKIIPLKNNVRKIASNNNFNGITILPNATPLVNYNLYDQFRNVLTLSGGTLDYDSVTYYGNVDYGLTYKTDSHLMKNSEWGAITYLAHSRYGIDVNVGVNSYNDDGNYLTGCGSTVEEDDSGSEPVIDDPGTKSVQQSYRSLTSKGKLTTIDSSTTCVNGYGTSSEYSQSTTGNITGVFDMAGGASESVMGYLDSDGSGSGGAEQKSYKNNKTKKSSMQKMSNSLKKISYPYNNNTGISNEFFTNSNNYKYFDIYSGSVFTGDNSNNLTFCTLATCGGHALNETANWYGSDSIFVDGNTPFFIRGGSSIFDFVSDSGNYDNTTFRSILVPSGLTEPPGSGGGGGVIEK